MSVGVTAHEASHIYQILSEWAVLVLMMGRRGHILYNGLPIVYGK